MDLLTTCIHHSEVRFNIASLLRPTIHSLPQPVVPSTAFPSQRILLTEILQISVLTTLLSEEYPVAKLSTELWRQFPSRELLGTDHSENTPSIVVEAYLSRRCTATVEAQAT
jgi:hypothetical protein